MNQLTTPNIIANLRRQASELLMGIYSLNKYTLQDLSNRFQSYKYGCLDVVRLLDDMKLKSEILSEVEIIEKEFNHALRVKLEESACNAQTGHFRIFGGLV